MSSPKVSIITIDYNNLDGLKETLKSVSVQDYRDFEHLVIDGASTDGTIPFLENYSDHQINFTTESDRGIYDAMNKGIRQATGEWIIFMNAGDTFATRDVLKKIDLTSETGVIYGNSKARYTDGFSRDIVAKSTDSLWKGMSFTHQAVFLRRSLAKANPFDLDYKYCADFNQLFQLYQSGVQFTKVDLLIASIEAGGLSDTKRYKASAEVYRVNRKLNRNFKIHPYFISKIVWGFLVVKLKSILPRRIKSSLLKKKYRSA